MKSPSRNEPCPCGSGKKYKQCCLKREATAAAGAHPLNMSIPEMLQEAIRHHQAGQLPQANTIYQAILQVEPEHPDALHLSGLIAHQMGNNDLAVEMIDKAIQINPTMPSYYNNLGTALQDQGKLNEAVEHYHKALSLQPDYVKAHFNLGKIHKEQGKLDEAVEHCYKALTLQPDYAEAHVNLGIALKEQGKLDDAIGHYQKALLIKPDFAEGYNNLGAALKDQGKLDEAVEQYLKALAIRSDYVEAHYNLGVVLKDQGKLDKAIEHYHHALAIKPEFAEAYSNLGNALQEQGKFDEAVEHCLKALTLKPDFAEAHDNLGNALQAQGKLDEAIKHYHKALSIKPNYIEVHNNLGLALQGQGKLNEAVEHYHKALSIKPDHAESYNNLGVALKEQGKLEEAVESYRQALLLKPDFMEAHSNLGVALHEQGRLDEAIEYCRQALFLKPDYVKAHYNLGSSLQDQGKLDEAIEHYRKAILIKPDYAEVHSNLLFALNFHPYLNLDEVYRAAQEYDARIGIPLRPTWQEHGNDKSPDRRLRVGYVSPDFRRHAVAYFAEPILANHDKAQVEIFCYAEVRQEDEISARFRQLADHWHSTVGLSDEATAQMIRDHRIDILVDLTGHTAKNRLTVFARKPAPIQLTYLGYPGTTGLSAMDYRITDHYADPAGIADAYYAERLLRLPHSLWCYRPSVDMPETSVLPALARGYLTFGSFNNFNKIDRPTLELWAELLRALPSSRLMILTVPEGEARQRLLHSSAELGVDPQRLELHGPLPYAEFHRKFLEVDLTLDPVNVNGATTTCESLWMGVPVISLVSKRFLTRAGLSILSTVGLNDFAVASREDYIHIAAHLAGNLPLLAEIRAGLRAYVAASPLIDEVGFTRNLEALYRKIWVKWCDAI